MELLKDRPLFTMCLASIFLMVLTISLGERFFYFIALFLFIALLVTVIAIAVFAIKKKELMLKINMCVLIFIIISSSLIFSASKFYIFDTQVVENISSRECEITAEVIEIRYRQEFCETLYINLISADGIDININAIMEIEGSTELEEGNIFTAIVEFSEFDEYDSYLKSDGYVAKVILSEIDSIKVIGQADKSWSDFFKVLNEKVEKRIYQATDEKTGAFLSALLLGNRELVEDVIVRDFRRCGISHVLALSGLHMTIIMGFFEFILKKLNFIKSVRCVILMILSFGYLALTGFSMSAIRAAFMLCMVYLAYIFWAQADGVTSLALAVTVILIVSPYALFDISLWMSVLSTLGILVIYEIISPLGYLIKKRALWIQISYKLLVSVSLTLSAIFFVSFFNWFCFGEISLVTPLINLIVSPLITVIIVSGLILVICMSFVKPLATIVGDFVRYICEFVFDISNYVSNMHGITVSLKYDFAAFIILGISISLILFLILKIKRKWTIALIPTCAIIAFSICIGIHINETDGISKVTYLKNTSSEMLVVTNNQMATICDISTGGYAHMSDAYNVAFENGATEIENIILTHYHTHHPNALFKISQKYMVRNIFLPAPDSEKDQEILNQILNLLGDASTDLVIYDQGCSQRIGEECRITVSEKYYIERSEHPMFMISVKLNNDSEDNELLYYSSHLFESTHAEYPTFPDFIIIGSHGPLIKDSPRIDIPLKAKPKVLLLTNGEKMLCNDYIVYALDKLRDENEMEIIVDEDKFEFVLK